MKASIIVSATLSQGLLLPNIHILCTQNFPAKQYEVLLPDLGNFSREDYALLKHFEKQYPNFRVIENSGKNRSAMINEALRQSKGELLLFIESHCVADKNWLPDFVKLFSDKRIKAASGYIKTIPTDSWVGQAEEHQRKQVINRLEELGFMSSFFDFHNSAITRACFEEIGFLSEYIPILAEFEWGAFMHQKNIKINWFSKTIWHNNDSEFFSYSSIVFQHGRDKSRILAKHGKEFAKKYFFNSGFIRRLPFVKLFRIPLLFVTISLIYFGVVGVIVTKILRLNKASNIFFRCFASNSYNTGVLMGLKDLPFSKALN